MNPKFNITLLLVICTIFLTFIMPPHPQMMPEMREILFGVNVNRKFRD